jgi:ABC-type Mn2+/Zn2+ transport system permease subunit
MITDFLASWDLFYKSYLVGWLIAFQLSLIGVLVVARDQIFISMAMSQASTLGIALALWLSGLSVLQNVHWLQSDATLSLMAIVFSVGAALITARAAAAGRETPEAVTGWVFLLSVSGSILIVSHTPRGLDEIYRLLSSTIIGATNTDIALFGTLAVATALLLLANYRRLVLFAIDPPMAAALGMRVTWWAAMTYAWLGLAVGLSIRVAGVYYALACLVLPALAAKNLCHEVRTMFLVAPIIAVTSGVIGFVLADRYDYPPAQVAIALLCLVLACAWLYRRFARHQSGR